jgi:hypothetical protein
MPILKDLEECSINASSQDFNRDINILMADQDVQLKVKTLKIWALSSEKLHILDWLLLKSPNLTDLQIYWFLENNDIEGRRLEI